jgi:hypothetical protein
MDELEEATSDTFVFKPVSRIFPHMSTEALPDIFEPILPFLHFNGKLSSSDLMHYTATFLTDMIHVIGLFSLAMYKFELNDSVKIVDLNYTLGSTSLGRQSKVKHKTTSNL